MELRRELFIKEFSEQLELGEKIMLSGSCFTEHLGERFIQNHFPVLQNPNGIIFNPVSICKSITSYISNKKYSREDISPQINVSAEDLKGHWQFTIADNGIGIDKEYFEKIFVIFRRLHTRSEFSGTGIGLAITKKIIDAMGGKIWVESNDGNGSVFYFTIPKM